jgi:hypothetical protein
MGGPLARLGVGLQAVAQLAQELGDRREVRLVAEFAQGVGEVAHALGRPAQRRLGIAAVIVADQPLQLPQQLRVGLRQRLAATATAAHPARLERLARFKLAQPLLDRRRRHPRRARDRRNSASPVRACLSRGPQATAALVELSRQRPVALTDRLLIDHTAPVPYNRHSSFRLNYLQSLTRRRARATSRARAGLSGRSGLAHGVEDRSSVAPGCPECRRPRRCKVVDRGRTALLDKVRLAGGEVADGLLGGVRAIDAGRVDHRDRHARMRHLRVDEHAVGRGPWGDA